MSDILPLDKDRNSHYSSWPPCIYPSADCRVLFRGFKKLVVLLCCTDKSLVHSLHMISSLLNPKYFQKTDDDDDDG